MISTIVPTFSTCIMGRRSISLLSYLFLLITYASPVLSFVTSSSSSSLLLLSSSWHHIIQRSHRSGPRQTSFKNRSSSSNRINISSSSSSSSSSRLNASKTRSNNSSSSSSTDTTKTLYDILGASPDATRSELKRAYVTLARQTHPDAILQKTIEKNNNKDDDDEEQQQPLESFDTIAQAYQTLNNPFERKRYDRQLRAKEFTDGVDKAFDNFGESNLFRKVVNPILRRGAVTTRKGWNAAVGDGEKTKKIAQSGASVGGDTGTEKDLGSLIDNVVRAGKEGWKEMDQLELLEESRELEEKAKEQEKSALTLNDTLSALMMSRIRLSLQTPNAPLTSLDALRVLDGMNTIDSVTLLDRTVRLRHTTSYDIELLSQTEEESDIKSKEHRMVSEELQKTKEKIRTTKGAVTDAEKAEVRAKKALENARKLVSSLKEEVVDCERALELKENLYRRTRVDAGMVAKEVNKRRETVRDSLRRKGGTVENENNDDKDMNGVGVNIESSDNYENVSYSDRMAQIEKYRKEEQYLIGKSSRLEEEASRFRDESKALIGRAEAIKRRNVSGQRR